MDSHTERETLRFESRDAMEEIAPSVRWAFGFYLYLMVLNHCPTCPKLWHSSLRSIHLRQVHKKPLQLIWKPKSRPGIWLQREQNTLTKHLNFWNKTLKLLAEGFVCYQPSAALVCFHRYGRIKAILQKASVRTEQWGCCAWWTVAGGRYGAGLASPCYCCPCN